MSKFKVGDQVRCVSRDFDGFLTYFNCITVGKVYTVQRSLGCNLYVNDDDGDAAYIPADNFELVQPEPVEDKALTYLRDRILSLAPQVDSDTDEAVLAELENMLAAVFGMGLVATRSEVTYSLVPIQK